MKYILLLFLLLPLSLLAQTHLIGVRTGVSVSNISGYPVDQDQRVGYTVGASYDYLFNKHFSITTGVDYLQRGYQGHLTIRDAADHIIADGTYKYHMDYIGIPVKGAITIGSKWYAFVAGGGIPSFLVKERSRDVAPNSQFSWHSRSNARSFDFAFTSELGGGYKFEKVWCFISGNATSSASSFYNSLHHHALAVVVGVKKAL